MIDMINPRVEVCQEARFLWSLKVLHDLPRRRGESEVVITMEIDGFMPRLTRRAAIRAGMRYIRRERRRRESAMISMYTYGGPWS